MAVRKREKTWRFVKLCTSSKRRKIPKLRKNQGELRYVQNHVCLPRQYLPLTYG